MSKIISIFGSGGHAKVVIESALLNNFKIDCLFDDDFNKFNLNFGQYIISGPIDVNHKGPLIIAIGNNEIRKQISVRVSKANWLTVIHPAAIISNDVLICEGSVVMAGGIIQPGNRIGKHCIINTGACIDHDCYIGDYVHISPKVTLSGGVSVGEGTHIGVNACVIPGIKIGKWVTIGAGSVIISDVPDYAVIVGNPGKVIKYNYE